MRARVVLGIVAGLMSVGCASVQTAAQGAEPDFSSSTRRANPSLRVGQAHVIEGRVRPELPVGKPEASRVQLEGGRFIVCWTRGSVEEGRRALAQAFKADGSPLGAPVVISPPDIDVIGAPVAIATDGQHAVATFAGASETSTELLAVPIETQTIGDMSKQTAQR
jgi:hypothetical protein